MCAELFSSPSVEEIHLVPAIGGAVANFFDPHAVAPARQAALDAIGLAPLAARPVPVPVPVVLLDEHHVAVLHARRMAPAIPPRDVSPPNLAASFGAPPFCSPRGAGERAPGAIALLASS